MKKTIFTTLLFLVFAVQWGVPFKMIYDNENTLTTGKAFRFKTQPIDPSDPFRGAYIVLNFEMNSFETNKEDWKYGDNIYILLTEDSLGFAKVRDVSKEKPQEDFYFVEGKYRSHYYGKVNFDLPFDRFYLNEKKAYNAELAYREAQRDSLPNNSYALVFVKNGKSVLADVLVNGTSVTKLKEE